MPANSIVKTLDVIKDVWLGILPFRVDVALDSLLLQTAEERLCNRIVPTVSLRLMLGTNWLRDYVMGVGYH